MSMSRKIRGIFRHASYANVVASVAMFVALGGASYAAVKLPSNSVGTAQIKTGAVTSKKIRKSSLLATDFKQGQLPDGTQGPAGAIGSQGITGLQGRQGEKGDAGTIGAQGPQGEKGAIGATGSQGGTGVTGPQGPQGEKGTQGGKGDTGTIGAQGPQGEKGAIGATGATGSQGGTGVTGPQGPQGGKGDTGAQGIPGLSNYTIVETNVKRIPPKTAGGQTAKCPKGMKALSGGVYTFGGTINAELYVQWSSMRFLEGEPGWSAMVYNPSENPGEMIVEVICATIE
jgi:hypothetical protein